MNAEEQRLLTGFLDQLKGIRGIQKDPDADLLIRKVAGEQPDALYLLVQKALIQDQALSGARQQIMALERQLEDARTPSGTSSSGGFLSQNPWSGATSRQQPAAMAAPQAPSSLDGTSCADVIGLWRLPRIGSRYGGRCRRRRVPLSWYRKHDGAPWRWVWLF